jgi:hypothetical protein
LAQRSPPYTAPRTSVTNVFSGRPARALVNRLACEIGFLADAVPDFPLPLGGLEPYRWQSLVVTSQGFDLTGYLVDALVDVMQKPKEAAEKAMAGLASLSA